jgi:hypothetical protein
MANMSEDAIREYEAVTGKKISQQFGVNDKEFTEFSKQMKKLAEEQARHAAKT